MLHSLKVSRSRLWVLAWVGVFCGTSCSGGTEANASATSEFEIEENPEAIAGGAVDAVNAAVFGMWIRRGLSGGLCSATLIAPNLMLTARHCVSPPAERETGVNCLKDEFLTPISPESMKFSNAVHPRWNDLWYSAKRVLVNEASNRSCGSDIALVVLSEPVPPSVALPVSPRLKGVDIGELYTAVGYGLDSTETALAQSGTRHVLTGRSVVCSGTSCGEGTAATEFQGTSGVCSGDSGGPALDSEGRVMGLLSRGPDPCDDPVYTAVFAFRELLLTSAQEAAKEAGGTLPEWAGGSVPSASAAGADSAASASASSNAAPEPERPQEPAEVTEAGLPPEASCSVADRAPGSGTVRSPWFLFAALVGWWRRRRGALTAQASR